MSLVPSSIKEGDSIAARVKKIHAEQAFLKQQEQEEAAIQTFCNIMKFNSIRELLILKGYGRNDLNGRNKAEAEAFIYRKYIIGEDNSDEYESDNDIDAEDDASDEDYIPPGRFVPS